MYPRKNCINELYVCYLAGIENKVILFWVWVVACQASTSRIAYSNFYKYYRIKDWRTLE